MGRVVLSALRVDNFALVLAGRALPGRMSSQQGEDEGRAGHDAELAERHAEVSPRHRHGFSPDVPAVHFLYLKKQNKKNPSSQELFFFLLSCAYGGRQILQAG